MEMTAEKLFTDIVTDQESGGTEFRDVDLSWLRISDKMNETFRSRGVPTRLTFININDNTLYVTIRGHGVSLYLRREKRLFRLEGSLTLQWKMVERAFKAVVPDVMISR